MEEVTIVLGQLVLSIGGFIRRPVGEGLELVFVQLAIENRASGLGDARQAPAAELRDEQERTYELASEEGWSNLLQPETRTQAQLRFEVPVDASGLELAIAPGSDDEVIVPLFEAGVG